MTARNTSKAVAVAAEFMDAICELTSDNTITAPQVVLLLQLKIHGSIYQQDLPKYTRVQKSANSRYIAKLGMGERPLIQPGPGYVTSEPDLQDRRLQVVKLTQRGHALVDEAASRAGRFIVGV